MKEWRLSKKMREWKRKMVVECGMDETNNNSTPSKKKKKIACSENGGST